MLGFCLFALVALVAGGCVWLQSEDTKKPHGPSHGPALTGESDSVQHWRAKRCSEAPPPPREVELEKPFPLRCRESVKLRETDFVVTMEDVDYSPMQHANGVELFPQSLLELSIHCGGIVVRQTTSGGPGLQACGRSVKLVTIDGEDNATFVIQLASAKPK